MRFTYGPQFPETFTSHRYPEQMVDLGEIDMNYAVSGPTRAPALLLVPGQTESWWGYEAAMRLLERDFRVYAVDMRGQGRSSRTPGRYTLDNMGNDLVRFLDAVVGRPCIVAGLSSGGVLACWLAAYAPPGAIRGVMLEDPPLFASELTPACGHSILQGAYSRMFHLRATFLGDQWSIGDWEGYVRASATALPEAMRHLAPTGAEPPQNLREYDPEWARSFLSGAASAACDHARMLAHVRVPVLFTQHFRAIDPVGDILLGACSDVQAGEARRLIESAGRPIEYRSFPDAAHFLHAEDPQLYAATLSSWALALPGT